MGSESSFSLSDLTILKRMIGPDRADLSIAAARAILKLDFEPGNHARMHELSMKAQEGSLNAEEQAEIDAYGRVGCLLGIMHSLARQSLKRRSVRTNPMDEALSDLVRRRADSVANTAASRRHLRDPPSRSITLSLASTVGPRSPATSRSPASTATAIRDRT